MANCDSLFLYILLYKVIIDLFALFIYGNINLFLRKSIFYFKEISFWQLEPTMYVLLFKSI